MNMESLLKGCRFLPLFALFFCPFFTSAQEGFNKNPSFQEIQQVLDEGRSNHDFRKQALAWYYWAKYEHNNNSDSDSAFTYLARSIDRFRKTPDTLAYQHARMDQADWMAKRGLSDEALRMQMEALNYFKRVGEAHLETDLLLRMSRNYMIKGDTATGMTYRRYFRLKNAQTKDTLLEISVLMDEVTRLQREHRYPDAVSLSKRTLDLARNIHNNSSVAWASYNIGMMSASERDYPTARRYLRDAERVSQNEPFTRHNIYKYLAKTYEKLDSMPLALHYANLYGELTDSLYIRDRSAAIQKVTLEFDTRQKRNEIKDLEKQKKEVQDMVNQQRYLAASLAVGLAAVLLAMFFIIRDYRHRLHTNRVITSQTEEINQQKIRELEDFHKIETMQSMLAGQSSERERIAHDLHDSLGGLLAAAKLQIESLPDKFPELKMSKDVQKIKALLDETVSETRQIARNLQPSSLVQFGLIHAIKDLTGRVESEGGPIITFQHFGEVADLDQEVALNCYRVVQELLQNSLKHAKASEILVQLTRNGPELAILVEDDGIGFDPEQAQKGMGTGNIVQRVRFIKGDLSVQSTPGQGTSTMFTIPVGPGPI
jgi:signal transduction histidine kinase